jgi:hypothetical protein
VNPNTGEIHIDVSEADAKKRGLIPIPGNELEGLINKNRKQRRAWAAQQRKKAKAT